MSATRHPRLGTRTQKDEVLYDEQCRRENEVKGEVIKALLDEVSALRSNQVILFEKLLEAEKSLNAYRENHLEVSRQRAKLGRDVPGFYWDDVDGWHRESERKQ